MWNKLGVRWSTRIWLPFTSSVPCSDAHYPQLFVMCYSYWLRGGRSYLAGCFQWAWCFSHIGFCTELGPIISEFFPSALTNVSEINNGMRIMIQIGTKKNPVRACLVFGNNGETSIRSIRPHWSSLIIPRPNLKLPESAQWLMHEHPWPGLTTTVKLMKPRPFRGTVGAGWMID